MLSFSLFIFLTFFLIASRYIKLYSAINIFFIFLVSCFFSLNRQNNDYDGYVEIFKAPASYAEPGYVFLVNVIKIFNGDYNVLISLLGVLVFITFYRLLKYSNIIAFSMLCYMIFPMPIDITQVRNTIALMFFINALIDLSKSRLIISLLFVSISISFHFFGVVYFLIWIGLHFRYHPKFKVFILMLVLLSFALAPFLIPLLGSVSSLRTISYYLSSSLKIHSLIIWGVSLFVDLLLIDYFVKRIKIHVSESTMRFIIVLYSTLLLMLAFSSGLLFVDEFNRLFRTGYVLKYILVASIIPFLSLKNSLILISYVFFSVLVMGIYFTVMLNYDFILFGL
jgi:hypothetical protein